MAPTLIGWVVFAADLDAREMRGLERLSAIPLHAAVLAKSNGRWSEAAGSMSALNGPTAALAESHVRSGAAFEMGVAGDQFDRRSPSRFRPSRTSERAILLLAYPKAQALADARKLQFALALMTLLGLLLMGFATWRAAGRITQPLARLDEAAGRLASGEHVQVRVRGSDELARLATSFNEMVGKIAEREQRITQLAFNDVLTGLPNRTMFHQQLEQLFRASEGSGALFALHCLDLDQFKVINDTLGHPGGRRTAGRSGAAAAPRCARPFRRPAGRRRVRRPAERRRRSRRDRPAGARDPDAYRAAAQHRRQRVGAVDQHRHRDCARRRRDGGTLAEERRPRALSRQGGGPRDLRFLRGKPERARAGAAPARIRPAVALERGELELHYQPLFDLEHNRICSFEALLRWNHPKRGLISPVDFIPVAEDTGLIVPIGAWVVREACAQAAHWPEHIRVAVNVSPVQFHRGAAPRNDPARAWRPRPRAGAARGGDHRNHLPRG